MIRALRRLLGFNSPKDYKEDGDDIKWEDTIEFTYPVKG